MTGRFQPLHNDHLGVVKVILRSLPKHRLTIAVADWKGERSRSNFLTGREATALVALGLADWHLDGQVDVQTVSVSPEGYIINHNLARRLRDLPEGPKRPWGNELDASYPPSGREQV